MTSKLKKKFATPERQFVYFWHFFIFGKLNLFVCSNKEYNENFLVGWSLLLYNWSACNCPTDSDHRK